MVIIIALGFDFYNQEGCVNHNILIMGQNFVSIVSIETLMTAIFKPISKAY